ncbi:MAG: EamA family transporter [Firmicutes bacterium]|nr:EamA family transporter [Bacillota bacterium]
MRTKLTKGDLLMASAVVAWGFSYIFMKWGLGSCTPFQIIFLRFGIAFPFLLLIFNKKVIPTKAELKFSIFLAVAVFALSVGYNYGLLTTDASTAGFLAGTTVAMIPIINGILKRKMPEKKVMLCAVLALIGIALMSITSELQISIGALFCIGGAVAYAVQVIITNRALEKCRAMTIAVWQLGFTSLFALIAMLFFGQMAITLTPMGWVGVLGLAFVSSAYGYIAQTIAQKTVTPERVGFLYSLEPVSCAVLAFIFFGEIMSLQELGGAILIMISILI